MMNRGKRWYGGTSGIAITVAAGALMYATPAFAQLSGGQVVGGQATISGQGTSQTTITQTSDRAIVNWDRFSLRDGDMAVFQQPDAKSITVNRVAGSDPSTILGSIKANGQVVLINRNGVLFGKGSQVDTAGLIVSTHDIDAKGFMRGDSLLRFSDGGNDQAEIVVEGRITIRDAGMAAFVAPHVRNSGLIMADMGRVSLAAGKGFGIDLYGDGLVRFAASDAITDTLKDASGKPIKALVENDGTIAAQGGKILLSAAAARDVVNASVNVSGIVRADSVSAQGGVITLSGPGGIGTETGSVISAAGASGGSVTITGGSVGLGGLIDASSTGVKQTGGTVAVKSDGLLSLGGTTRALSELGSGGNVTYAAENLLENSDSRTDVSGKIDGGTIRSLIRDGARISGRYIADGLYGLGGWIDMTATDMLLVGATVLATGRSGGGLVRLGGPFQGGKTPDETQASTQSFLGRWGTMPKLSKANENFVDDATTINVASSEGRGGTAIVWSNAKTTFLGAIDARGSGAKGSGGAVEISSEDNLYRADLGRVQASDGYLLLDPKNLIVGDVNQSETNGVQNVKASDVAAQLDSGTGVKLQSSNDLYFNSAINSPNATGVLELYAGRSLLINASISIAGTVSMAANVPTSSGTVDAQRDSGAAVVTMASGTSITSKNDFYLTLADGAGLTNRTSGDVTLASVSATTLTIQNQGISPGSALILTNGNTLTASGANGSQRVALALSAPIFKNNAGANALSAPNGNWDIRSDSPANDTVGGLLFDFKQYNVDNVPVSGTGNGLLYRVAPVLTATLGAYSKTYDGSDSGSITSLTVSGTFSGDSASIRSTGASFRSKNVVANNTLTAVGVSATVTSSNGQATKPVYGYAIASTVTNTASSIAAKTLSVTAPTIASKAYDGTTSAGSVTVGTLSGFVGSETVTASGNGAALSSKNVGSYTTTVAYTLADGSNGGLASNYTLASTTGVSAAITAKALSISGTNITAKAYDGTASAGTVNAGTVSGLIGSETLGVTGTAGTLSSKNVGSYTTSIAYTLANGSNGGLASNYTLASTSGVSAAIVAKSLTIGAPSIASKAYDGTTAAGTLTIGGLSGLVGSETLGVSGMAGALSGKNVGSYTTAVSYTLADGGNGGLASNYTLASTSGVSAAITAKALSISGTNITAKAYDGTTSAGTVNAGTVSGLIGSETLGVTGTAGTLSSKNVGSYTTSVAYTLANGSNGGLASNYSLGSTSGVSAAIIAKSLTIGAPSIASKAYDGTTVAGTLTIGSLSGLVGSETLGVSGTAAALTGKNVGSYTTAVSYTLADGSNGGLSSNYTLASTSGVSAAIVAKSLTIGAPSIASKAYDGTTAAGTLTIGGLSGLVGSETLNVSGTAAALMGKNAGSYTTTVAYLLADGSNGGLASNYTLTSTSGVSAEITAKALSISGTSITAKTYDGTTSAGAVNVGTVSGLIGSETLDVTGTAGTLSSKNVGSYTTSVAYTLANGSNGGLASNYSLGSTSGLSAEIMPAALTLSGSFVASDRVYDATTLASVATNGLSMTGVFAGDSVSFKTSGATGQFANKNVGTNKTVTLSASGVLTGADAGNYVLAAGAPTATATITPASLTVGGSFTASDRTYDATTVAAVTTSSLTLSGVLGSDAVSLKTSGATGSFANKNVGTNKTVTLNASGVLTGSDASNYVLAAGAPTATATITPASLTLGGSFTASDRTYDATTVAAVTTSSLTLSGVLGSDAVSLKTSGATGSFANKNAGTNKTVSLSATGVLTGADIANYVLGAGAPTATATITPASLVIAGVSAANKIYNGTTAAGLSGGTITVFSGDVVALSTANAVGAFANKNVGTGKAVTASGYAISGTDAGNYALVQPTGLTADITARTLNLSGSFTAQNKVYDATTTASIDTSGLGLSNAVAGDDVHLSLTGATGSFANKNVGNGKVVTLSTAGSLTGADAGNYTFTASAPTTTANITPASLMVTGVAVVDKVYDATTTATLTGGAVSPLGNDVVTLVTTGVTGNFADKNAGSGKAVTVSGYMISGTDAGNYTLTQPSGLTGTITAKSLTIGAPSIASKAYDGTTVAGTLTIGSLSGLVGSETLGVSGTAAALTGKNVGSYTTAVSYTLADGSNGGLSSNYTLASTSGVSAAIVAKSLTIGAPSIASKAYDGTTAAGTLTIGGLSGLVGSETLNVSGTAAALMGKNAGSYTTTVAYLLADGSNGGLASNYTLTSTSGVSAEITAKALSISGTSITAKTYDGTTSAGAVNVGTVSGLIGSETLDVTGTAGTLSSKNVGSYTTSVAYTLANGSNGGLASNYSLSATNGVSAIITAKTLAVTGVTVTSKVYDGTAAATLNGGALSGLVSGDTVVLADGRGLFADKNVGTGKTVTASGYSLSGTDAGNYTLVQPSRLTGTITPRALSVSGSFTAQNKVYDAGTAAVIDVSGLGLSNTVAGDDVHLNLSGATGSFANKNVGVAKTVTLSTAGALTGADAGNYSFTASAPTTTANITSASLAVAGVSASSKVYDASTVAYLTGGSVNPLASDVVTLVKTGASGAFADKNVGTGKAVTASGYTISGTDAGNYTLVQPSGLTADITQASLTISGVTAANKVYDATRTAGLSGGVVSALGSDVVTLVKTGASGDFADKNVGTGKAVTASGYTIAGTDAGNYALVQPVGLTADITRASLAVTGVTAMDKVYNATTAADLTGGSVTALGNDVVTLSTSGAVGRFANKNVGTAKAVSVSGYAISGADAGNYALIQPTGVTADITARTLGVSGSFTALDKVYDATTTASIDTSGLGLSNAVAGDDVGLNLAGASGRFADKNVGAGKLVTLSTAGSLTGADAGNYSFAASAPTTTASITPATLNVVGVSALGRVYDASTIASLTGGSVRPLGSDAVTLVITGAVGAFADKNVGTGKSVLASGYTISGTDAGNYTLVQPTGLTADITRASLAVTGVTAADKVYDATTAANLSGGSVTALGNDVVTLSTSGAVGRFANKNVGTAKAVSASGYAISGTDAGNYALIQPTGLAANITQASLLVTGVTVADKVYDAGTSATLSGGAVAALSGDVVTLVTTSATGNFATKNVGTGKAVTASGYTISGTDAGNYALIQPVGLTGNIAKANLTVTGVKASSKTYDGTDTAGLSGGGIAALGSDVVTLSTSGAVGRFASKNVGAGKVVTASGYTISGVDAGNYTLIQPVGLTATIDPRTLAVSGSFTAQDKVYDATTIASIDTSGLSLANAVVGDDVRLNLNGATGHFASKTVGNAKLVTLSTAGSLAGADADNYVFNASAPTTTANITPATLNVVGVSALGKVYDASVAAGLTGGAVTALGSDVVALVTGGATASFADKNVGSGKAVTASGYAISGTDAGNYTLVQPTGLTADITQAVLAVTGVTAQSKVYDATTTAALSGGTVTALGHDVVLLSTNGASGVFADKNVGAGKAVSASGYAISGADAGNYTLAQPTGLTATITPAVLALAGTFTAQNKVYDATTSARVDTTGLTLSGVMNGDAVALNLAGATGQFTDKNVGTAKRVTLSTAGVLSGADAGNYSYSALAPTTTANITPATLRVVGVSALSKVYDANVAAGLTGGSVTALGSDVVALVASGATGTFADKNVGSGKAVTASGYAISGTDAGNYTLVQPTGLTADISQAILGVTGVTAQSKVYDATTTAALSGGTVTALGQDVVILSTLGATGRFDDKNVGYGKRVSVSGYAISGADAGNYMLVQPTGLVASITPATLSVAGVRAANKTYDANTLASLSGGSVTAFGGDAVTLVTIGASGKFGDKNVGTGKTVLASGYALSGVDAGNYLLAQPVGLTADISQATLAVTGVTAQNKVYDAGVDATLTGGVVSALPGDVVTLLTGSAAGRFADKNVGSAKAVAASGYAISGADAGNYVLAQPTGLSASITPASLTLAGGFTAQNKVYDTTTLAQVDVGGLSIAGVLTGDTVGLNLNGATGSFADKNVGTAKIVTLSTTGSLTGLDAGNYVVVSALPTTTADISRANLAVSGVTALGKVYDATTVATLTGGMVRPLGSDMVTLSTAGAVGRFADRNAGTAKAVTASGYTISGTDAGNYTLIQPTGLSADISRASLTVQGVSALSKVYDGTVDAALSGGTVSALGADVVILSTSGASGRFADKNVGAGKAVTASGYAISGADAGNYLLVQPTGLRASITPASLTLAGGFTARNKVYDASVAAQVDVSGLSLAGLMAGDTVGLDLSGATGAFADKNVGTAKRVTLDVMGTLTGADAGNYRLVSTALTTTADITPANLAVLGVTARDKVYDATTAATLMGGTVNALGDDVVTLSAAGASGRFATKDVGTAKTVTASGYAISGADARNYTLIQPTGLTATITRATLVVDGMTIQNRSYDAGTDATFTGGDVRPLAQDAVQLDASSAQARFATKNVGNGKTVSVSGLTLIGADAGNYALVQPTGLTADITPAQLFVTGARAADKVYDATTLAAISGGSVTAFAGDSVTLDTAGVSGAFANRMAGVGKAVTVSGYTLGGADAGNYSVVQPTGLTATITPAPLSVQGVTVANKVYDGGDAASASGGFVTALAPDTVALVTTGAVARFDDRNVGTNKVVVASGYTLGGADAGNYTIVQPTGLTADITRLASVVWTGKGDGKSWFDPANWAGGAIPDGANVADVVLPASTAISFDGAERVSIDRLLTTPDADTVPSSTDTALTLLKGNLVIAKDLSVDTLIQRGGALTGAGNVTVLDGFTQTGGAIAMMGDVAIHQGGADLETLSISGRDVTLVGDQAVRAGGTTASRDLTIIAGGDAVLRGPTTVGRNLSVTAGKSGAGRILQDQYVTVTGDAVLNAVGDITLTNSGNHFGGTVSCTSGSGKISGSCTAGGLIDQARVAADSLAARAAAISSASGGGLGATFIGAGNLFTGGPATVGGLLPGAPAFEAMANTPVSTGATGVAALLQGEPADATIAGGAGSMLTDAVMTSQADTTYVTARFGDRDAKAVYRQVVPQTNLGNAVYYVGN
ncbi:YDG domain-containing protein [Sphingomonas fuzhouensis]|uniref:YDG domain-containing protein n=1 Tax=Sphingomonas fuzhouensis TaxID=3106033 RepID=UPI002AFDE11B|nr:YDG domain-containing protein [Sphingomonas sp. SGZ-02]